MRDCSYAKPLCFFGQSLSRLLLVLLTLVHATAAGASPISAYEEQLRYVEQKLPGEIHAYYSSILDQNFNSRRYDIESIAAGLIEAHIKRRQQWLSVSEKWEKKFMSEGDAADASQLAIWMIEFGNDQRTLTRTLGALQLIQRDFEDLLRIRDESCKDSGLNHALRELRPERLIPVQHLQFDPTQGLVSSFPIRAQIALTFNGGTPVFDLSPGDRGPGDLESAVAGLSAHYSTQLASHWELGGFESYLLQRTFESGAFLIKGLFEKDWNAEKQKLITRINESFRKAVLEEQRKSASLILERCTSAFTELDSDGNPIGMSAASLTDMRSRLEASLNGLSAASREMAEKGRDLAAGYESSLQRSRGELSVLRENWQRRLRERGHAGVARQRAIHTHFSTYLNERVSALRDVSTAPEVLDRYGYEMELRDSIWSGLLAGDLRFRSQDSQTIDPFWNSLKVEIQKEVRR